MSSSRFLRLVQDAHALGDLEKARLAYGDWQLSHCIHPEQVLVYDAHSQVQRFIDVPCGRCYHCTETKINEWVTRMYAHVEDFKHVYFVTLTYRSITDPKVPVNSLLLSKLSQAVWHRDALNATKHYSYNPCLLCKSHYQNFLKRLRKNTGLSDISYVLCGEYGSKYGRPHFHMVLFTNGELTRRDIELAWSVCLWRDSAGNWTFRRNQKYDGVAYNFPIGRVDYNDLVRNGTFNTTAKVRVDGNYMSASNCFSYVCKYVVKRDVCNTSRVDLSYKALYHKQTYVKLFSHEVQYNMAFAWLREHGYSVTQAKQVKEKLKKLQYEKTVYLPDSAVYFDGLLRQKKKRVFGFESVEELLPLFRADYFKKYCPFVEFSRGTPIGSVYARRHIQEFKEGVFKRPLLQDKSFVVPSYFRRKGQEQIYGLRVEHKTISGRSYNLGPLLTLQGYLQSLSDATDGRNSTPFVEVCRGQFCRMYGRAPAFYEASTKEHIRLSDNFAEYYRYSRKGKEYIKTRSVPLSLWIRFNLSSLQFEFKRYAEMCRQVQVNKRCEDAAFCLITDLGEDKKVLVGRYENVLKQNLVQRQSVYKELHASVE